MTCCTANLATRQTILATTIEVDTMKRYLATAKGFSFNRKLTYHMLDVYGNVDKHIASILKEATRWGKVPNRKESVTPEMIDYVIGKAK